MNGMCGTNSRGDAPSLSYVARGAMPHRYRMSLEGRCPIVIVCRSRGDAPSLSYVAPSGLYTPSPEGATYDNDGASPLERGIAPRRQPRRGDIRYRRGIAPRAMGHRPSNGASPLEDSPEGAIYDTDGASPLERDIAPRRQPRRGDIRYRRGIAPRTGHRPSSDGTSPLEDSPEGATYDNDGASPLERGIAPRTT